MAELTGAQVEEIVASIAAVFVDGFQVADITKVIAAAMQGVEQAKGMTGPEKKASALKIIERVIDDVDLPWCPDALVDPVLKKLAPHVIELVIDAASGKIVN
jgi:hypothetical protein